MTEAQNDANNSLDKQSIEQLRQRYDGLNTRKIQAETQREEAHKHLENLKREASDKYDTDDITELKEKLKKMKTENEEKRATYQADLDKIEQGLRDVEKKFSPQSGAEDEEQA